MHTSSNFSDQTNSLLQVAVDFVAQRCEVNSVGEEIHLHVILTQDEMNRLALFGAMVDELEDPDSYE
ncbi:hypothetical protein [Pseudovibrio sp. Ad37]|uniref:hypothetical protein n=1 Tax=Pseudovibrio sp. Ad37 TaxID=989422 RepID=UPI0007AE576F|nr:hypothetical protein [Pseudovibrio sp. Ad37]KZL13607.1 hypothetical protein PsAD37_05364 [Pseudovibrio sp. Ad37]